MRCCAVFGLIRSFNMQRSMQQNMQRGLRAGSPLARYPQTPLLLLTSFISKYSRNLGKVPHAFVRTSRLDSFCGHYANLQVEK
jgi:hypothetical protein